jgi:putative SOS response-associated peptidase YedK
MPVVLTPDAWDEWLDPKPLPTTLLAELFAPAAEDLLAVHPVSGAVNNARNDGPALIERVDATAPTWQLQLVDQQAP